MKTNSPTATAEIVDFPGAKTKRFRSDDKWSPEVMKFGFTSVPNLLLDAQAKLKISPVQLSVLIQLLEHWWDADADPYPAKETIARRLGKSPRQIQRYITELEEKGLLTRVNRYYGRKRQTSNAYSLDGLVKKLKELVPEFTAAREERKLKAKLLRKKVEGAAST